MQDHIIFSDRLVVESLFKYWCKNTGANEEIQSFLIYMENNGWINIQKLLQDVRPKKDKILNHR